MAGLLTAKEVQELLNVDRTTIYRMLKDGRLEGVKIGQQWRFSEAHIEALLSGEKTDDNMVSPDDFFEALPVHCMQPIQDVFAEIADVGSVVTDKEGFPLTRISNSCDFCKLILGSTEGRKSCFASWKGIAENENEKPEFVQCHAGLLYARGKIEVQGELIASLIAGQFYAEEPDPDEETRRVETLARKYDINSDLLKAAAADISLGKKGEVDRLGAWLQRIADTFGEISGERADLMARLKKISEVTVLGD